MTDTVDIHRSRSNHTPSSGSVVSYRAKWGSFSRVVGITTVCLLTVDVDAWPNVPFLRSPADLSLWHWWYTHTEYIDDRDYTAWKSPLKHHRIMLLYLFSLRLRHVDHCRLSLHSVKAMQSNDSMRLCRTAPYHVLFILYSYSLLSYTILIYPNILSVLQLYSSTSILLYTWSY